MRKQSIKIIFLFCIILSIVSNAHAQTLPDSIVKKIDRLFSQWDKPNTPGCVIGIVSKSSLIYTRGYGMADMEHGIPIKPATVFYMASVSKQFTGYSIVLLARSGKIKLDEDIHVYLPWVPDFGQRITMRNLLNHTSGIRDDIALAAIAGIGQDGMLTQELALNIIKRQRTLNFSPGEQYGYSNSNFILLAEIVKSVSGKSFRAFCDSAIFRPLGMLHTRFQDDYTELIPNRAFSYSPRGKSDFVNRFQNVYTVGDGGLFANITDMAQWVANYFNPKAGDRKDIDQLTEKGKLNNGKIINYALGVSVGEYNGWKEFRHSGDLAGYHTYLSIFPDLKMGFLVFSNLSDFDASARLHEIADLFIRDTLQPNRITAISKTDSSMAVLNDLTLANKAEGSYTSTNGLQISFRLNDRKLYADAFRQSFLLLKKTADTFSVFVAPDVKFCFSKDFDRDKKVVVLFPNQEPQVFTKDAPYAAASDSVLQLYTGTYFSPELDCRFHIILKNHRLVLASNKYEDAPLSLTGKDDLVDESGLLSSFKIFRDANSNIKGFEVNSAQIMHLRFNKIE
jgi:CubicO group peptidase (beta-lactamase class C family)